MGGGKRRRGGGGGGGGGGGEAGRRVGEAGRLGLELQLAGLLAGDLAELALPSSLSQIERAFVHERAVALGLRTKSRGQGAKRYVTVYKRTVSTLVQKDATFSLDPSVRQVVADLIEKFPITSKEKDDLTNCEREKNGHVSIGGHITNWVPNVPPTTICAPDMSNFKRTLPISNYRDQIISLVNSNQVVVIVGETGSGKTTQIPQFILDQYAKDKKSCRLICTQPRRISAVSVAERVAYERNEKIGQAIGYQIRLESRISPKTVLTYCTNGVMLRTLMGGASALSSITHIIVDEIHERDKFADFLLISLRDAMAKFKDLKVILMSATIDPALFSKYFNNCPILNIPGKMYDVQKFYLEDILSTLKYKSEDMKILERKVLGLAKTKKPIEPPPPQVKEPQEIIIETVSSEPIDPKLQADVDEFLNDCLSSGTLDSFGQILYMYTSEGVPINCQHSETGMTGLMVAAYHGCMDILEEIIKMGGDLVLKDKTGVTAYDYAISNGQTDCANYLQNLKTDAIQPSAAVVPDNDKSDLALELYQDSIDENAIDYELILAIIKHIHLSQPKGGILIFLTGYDDIIYLKDAIQMSSDMKQGSYQLFTLHSNMQTNDQKKMFVRSPSIRKIILSTNIAETSITIDDVVYVIDTGKAKEMYYESLTGVSSLQRSWISKACVLQRSGRAGRTQPGKAYLIYSKRRFDNLPKQSLAEILRVPLHELCLQTKLLAPNSTTIADYLTKALEPPSLPMIKSSVTLLKTIGALTQMEDLTEIGQHLLGLTIEPKFGKMILYACMLKCLDPVLTIACSLAVREPFQINPNKDNKRVAGDIRKEFSANSLSDHMGLLRAFQAWQVSHRNKTERKFCKDNFISKASMEMIVGLRTQLMAQLRVIGFLKTKGTGDLKDLNQNSDKWYVVKAALVSGLYPSIARIDHDEMVLRTNKEAKLAFHPRSALHVRGGKSGVKASITNIPSDWIVYEEITRIGRICLIRCNTVVTPVTVALFGGPLRLSATALRMNLPGLSDDSDSDQEEGDALPVELSCLSIDDWISFTTSPQDALGIYFLRQKFSALMIRRMLHPFKVGNMDDKIIAAIVHILMNEERNVGLIQPTSIGRKPNMMDSQNMRSFGNDGDAGFIYDNRSGQAFNNSNVPKSHSYQGNHYMKQNKAQSGQTAQPFNRNKGPLSPQSGSLLLANIEKYSNTNNKKNNPMSLQNIRYFVLTSSDMKTVENSQSSGSWIFKSNTERKIAEAAQTGQKLIFFFSVETTSRFYGYAELLNMNNEKESPLTYKIKWVSTIQIFHNATRHIFNGFDENRHISTARDGDEICAESGRNLMNMMNHQMKKFRNTTAPT